MLVSTEKIWQKSFLHKQHGTAVIKIRTVTHTVWVRLREKRHWHTLIVQSDTTSMGIIYQSVLKVHWHLPFDLAISLSNMYITPAYIQKKVSTKFSLQYY